MKKLNYIQKEHKNEHPSFLCNNGSPLAHIDTIKKLPDIQDGISGWSGHKIVKNSFPSKMGLSLTFSHWVIETSSYPPYSPSFKKLCVSINLVLLVMEALMEKLAYTNASCSDTPWWCRWWDFRCGRERCGWRGGFWGSRTRLWPSASAFWSYSREDLDDLGMDLDLDTVRDVHGLRGEDGHHIRYSGCFSHSLALQLQLVMKGDEEFEIMEARNSREKKGREDKRTKTCRRGKIGNL